MFPLALTFQLLRNQKRCHGSRLSYRRHEVVQMEDILQDVGGYPRGGCPKSGFELRHPSLSASSPRLE